MYENLSLFTESDPNNLWSETTTRCTATLLRDWDTSYVYKDYGVGHFIDYEVWLDINISSASHTNTRMGLCKLSNTLDYRATNPGNSVYLSGVTTGHFHIDAQSKSNAASSSNKSYDTTYYLKVYRVSDRMYVKIYATASDRINNTNVLDTLDPGVGGADSTAWRYLYCGFSFDQGANGYQLTGYTENFDIISDEPTQETEIDNETLSLSDNLNIGVNLELEEQFGFGESIATNFLEEYIYETLSLNESLEVLINVEEEYNIINKFNLASQVLSNINNTITITKQELIDTIQKINTVKLVVSDLPNAFHSCYGKLYNLNNRIRTIGQTKTDIKNDFRLCFAWQKIGVIGAQSLGKEYIKIYFNNITPYNSINDIEQLDIDIDSISIDKRPNTSHTTTFTLACPYDTSKPSFETVVIIKYNDYILYKGYIVSINPTDNPEHISIDCRDEYWNKNRDMAWVYIGHITSPTVIPPSSGFISNLTFLTPIDFLKTKGISDDFEGGNFIPETMNLYDTGDSDAITATITNSGNFGWYYDVDGTKKIWRGGAGSVVNLERQEIGKNIRLYQVINHQITESCENIVNQLRGELGTVTYTTPGKNGTSETIETKQHWYSTQRLSAIPDWTSELEKNALIGGYGYNYHKDDGEYNKVFKNFRFIDIPAMISPTVGGENWTDIIPPYVVIERSFGTGISIPSGKLGEMEEGYSIDYQKGTLTLNEPFYFYDKNDNGEIITRKAPNITLILTKELWITHTQTITEQENPGSEISQQLGFITPKMGNYPKTILKVLNLPGLSNQIGFTWANRTGGSSVIIPSWNDNPYGNDVASWELSKTCDPKITGTITLTLDALIFYGIDLTKRIMIPGILSQPLNIMNITYNMNEFTVTLSVENWRYFNRNMSYQSHGVGISSSFIQGVSI